MKIELVSVTTNVSNNYGHDFDTAENNALSVIEIGARVCHATLPKIGQNKDIVIQCIRAGHYGILEHVSIGVLVFDVSRALSHQLVRHRHFSYCQESQRHVNYEEFNYVIPPEIEANEKAKQVFLTHAIQTQNAYKELRSLGIKKEDARFVLPQSCTTTLMFSANVRAWLEMFRQRLDRPAQWEIKMMSREIWNVLAERLPTIFNREVLEHQTKRDFTGLYSGDYV